MPPRRFVQPRPVPAIPSGTWRAAGFRFFKPVRIPRALPVEAFTQVRRVQIGSNGIDGGVISAGGSATVSVGPQGYGCRWYPNQVSVATASGANDASTVAFYLNVIGPGGFIAQSYAGGGDQPGIALPEMQPGDLLYAVWSGGKSGDWCQLTVTGPMDVLVP
jgi:hypothetical protein